MLNINKMSIILADLDDLIINFCDLETDFFNIMRTNKYYYNLIINNELFKQWKSVCFFVEAEDKFINSCAFNLLPLSKYLVSKYNIDIHANKEEALRSSCAGGYIDVAKWLINLSMQPGFTLIDIHANREEAFRWSCVNNHLDMAKWLIELSSGPNFKLIDIHARSDYAFDHCYMLQQYDVVKWLIELSNKPGFSPFSYKIISNLQ